MEEDFVSFADGTDEPKKIIHEFNVKPSLVTDLSTPWLDEHVKERSPPLLRLHNEILAFCDYISPTEDEIRIRNELYQEICDIAKELWPSCNIAVFGSQLSNILTPTSDLDIAILDVPVEKEGGIVNALFALGDSIREREIVSYLEVLSAAKVPIVKFDHVKSGLSVDICINNSSGITTGNIIKEFVNKYPPLKPLVLVLKIFLSQRRLHETYSGGIGSFVLCNMIVSFLQQRQRLSAFRYLPFNYNLGAMLIEFFQLYGSTFNYILSGISVKDCGRYYTKISKGTEFFVEHRPVTLSVENPDPSFADSPVDIGKNSFMIQKIRRAFEHAGQVLVCAANENYDMNKKHGSKKGSKSLSSVSLLSFIIRSDDPNLVSRLKLKRNRGGLISSDVNAKIEAESISISISICGSGSGSGSNSLSPSQSVISSSGSYCSNDQSRELNINSSSSFLENKKEDRTNRNNSIISKASVADKIESRKRRFGLDNMQTSSSSSTDDNKKHSDTDRKTKRTKWNKNGRKL